MSWYKPVDWFSTVDKAADNVLDKDNGLLTQIGGWVDNMNFTEEEQAEMNKGLIEGVRTFAIATMAENTDRSKTRRELSVFFIKFYAILVFLTGVTYPINEGWSQVWFALATSGGVIGLVTGIGAFFYGSSLVRNIKSKGVNS